jgi:hypothetical protein
MPTGLKRIYGQGHLHFITFSCYRRLPLLKTTRARDIFVRELGRVREELDSRWLWSEGDSNPKTQVHSEPGAPSAFLYSAQNTQSELLQ